MAGVASITSRHNPHTGTTDASVSYSTACTSDHDHSNAFFSTSLTSETPILQDSCDTSILSTRDCFAFVNGSYSSPIGTRKIHRTGVLPELEETEDGDKENVINSVNRMAGGLISNDIAVRGLRFIDNTRRQSVPSSVIPQIHIRLMRAKSPSNESILNQDDSFQLEETTEPASLSLDNSGAKSKIVSTPYIPHKRGWYLQKVGALFKRKSSKSLNNLTSKSTDDLSSHNSAQTHVSTVSKSQSYSTIHDIVEPRSERQTKAQIKEKMKTIHGILREGLTKKDTESRRSENVRFRTEHPMDMDENSIRNDNKVPSSRRQVQVKVHTPERSYSLIRQDSQRNDSSHVNFTRIPSLRRRKFHLDLHHQFTTFIPQEDGEVHVIKDATHIQPLENGNAFVTDILCNNMVLFGADGHPKITFSLEAGSEPYATCLASDGCLAVTLKRQGCVALWSAAGEPITEFGHSMLSGPTGIQCDGQGRFIVADEQANEVLIFSKEGELLTKLTPSSPEMEPHFKTSPLPQGLTSSVTHLCQSFFKQPRYVCLTHSGNYVIADSANHCIKIFDQDMHFISQFGSYGRGDGCFKFPYGVASDAEGNLYVADHFNNRVSIFSAEGEFIQHLLTLQDGIARPKSIAVFRCLLFVTHGDIRSNKVSVFTLRS